MYIDGKRYTSYYSFILIVGSGSKSLTTFTQSPGHNRSYTHPLPSRVGSRAASPLLPFTVSIPKATTAASPEPTRAISPPIVTRVGSPLNL